jgi:hypothetical protein
MVIETKNKLTLDRITTYQIKVPGVVNQKWVNKEDEMSVLVEDDNDGLPTTALIVTVDQAALHGLLRRFYSLGLPLISVIRIDDQ